MSDVGWYCAHVTCVSVTLWALNLGPTVTVVGQEWSCGMMPVSESSDGH